MSVGREVADAYIEVHGDLTPFRDDLNAQAGTAGRDAGKEAADEFGEAWEKNAKNELTSRWNSITKAFYTGKKVDWDRAIGAFGGENFEEAERRIKGFLDEMADADLFPQWEDDASGVRDELENVIEQMRNASVEAQKNRDAIAGAKEQTADWNKSLDGMIANFKKANLAKDFQAITEAMASENWSKISRQYESMDRLKKSVLETADAMRKLDDEQSRITDAEYRKIDLAISDVVRNQKKFGVDLDATSRKFKPIQFAMDRIKTSWARMDGTVRVVLGLIAAAAGPFAALLSAAAGSLTALVGSLALAATSIVPLVVGFGAMGVAIGLAVKSMDGINAAFPRIGESIGRMSRAWTTAAEAFGAEWGPALDIFLDRLATVAFTSVSYGRQMGEAFANITNAFTGIVDSPGMSALMDAMSTTLPTAVQGLGIGIAGVFGTLINLMAAAAPVAAALGEDFARWGTALQEATTAGLESGAITEVFEKGRESLLAWLDLLGSLGNALGTLFMLGADSGNSMLNSLTQIVDKFNAWMQTESGRATMLEWFRNAEGTVRALAPLVTGLATALSDLVTPESIALLRDLFSQLGELLPLVGQFLGAISQSGILNIFAEGLTAIGRGLSPLVGPMGEFATAVGGGLRGALEALGPLLQSIGEAVRPWAENFSQMAQEIMPKLEPAIRRVTEALAPLLSGLGEIGGVVSSVIAPLVGTLLTGIIEGVADTFEGFSKVITGVVDLVKNIFSGDWSAAWDSMKQIVSGAIQAAWGVLNVFVAGKMLLLLKSLVTKAPAFFRQAFEKAPTIIGDALKAIPGLITKFFGSATAVAGTAAVGIGTAILAAFASLVSGVVENFEAIKSAIGTALASVGPAVQAGLSVVGQFFADVWMNVVTGVTQFGLDVYTNLQAALSTLGTAVMTGLASVGQFFTDVWTSIVAGVTQFGLDVYTNLQTALLGISTGVSEGFASLLANIITFFQPITDFFTTAWEGIKTVFTTAVTGLTETFSGFFVAIGELLTVGWEAVVLIFTTVFETIKVLVAAAFLTIVGLITGDMALVNEAISAAWGLIQEMWGVVLTFLQTTVGEAWNNVVTATQTAFSSVQTFVSEAWTNVQTFISDALNNIKTFVSDSWNNVKQFTNDAMNNVKTVISDGWNNAKQITSDTWTNIKQFISDSWNNIKQFVNDGINNAKQAIQDGWNNAKQVTQQVWSAIKQTVQNEWNNLKQTIRDGIENAKNSIRDGWESAKSFTRDAWENIKSAVRDAWESVKNSVKTGVDNAINFVKELPGRASSAIRDGIGDMVSAGRDLVDGLVQGIRDAAGRAVEAAKGMVSDAIAGAKSILGINSPSKVFMAFGVFTGEGLAIGMDRSKGTVIAAAEQMAEAATAALDKSKMYSAGKDAAAGLAAGLSANKNLIQNSLGTLTTALEANATITAVPATAMSLSAAPAPTPSLPPVIFEKGSIVQNTKVQDPKIAANQLIDDIINKFSG